MKKFNELKDQMGTLKQLYDEYEKALCLSKEDLDQISSYKEKLAPFYEKVKSAVEPSAIFSIEAHKVTRNVSLIRAFDWINWDHGPEIILEPETFWFKCNANDWFQKRMHTNRVHLIVIYFWFSFSFTLVNLTFSVKRHPVKQRKMCLWH